MVLTEYDEEQHIANEKELSREEGRREGMEEGQVLKLISIVRKKAQKGQSPLEISEDLLEPQELIEEISMIIRNNPQISDQNVFEMWKGIN